MYTIYLYIYIYIYSSEKCLTLPIFIIYSSNFTVMISNTSLITPNKFTIFLITYIYSVSPAYFGVTYTFIRENFVSFT